MNVLVTGGAGYVGSICAEQLRRQGHRTVVYDNFSTGHRGAVPEGTALVEGDIASVEMVRRACARYAIDAVMHFAASALIDVSIRSPHVFYRNNVTGTLALLEAVKDCGITRFVFSSTAAVYGEPQQVPITEEHPCCPVNAYGDTKLAIEKALVWYQRAYGINAVGFRYFNASGASELLGEDHRPETHLIPRLFDAIEDPSKPFRIFGTDYPTPDGTCIRDFVHVRDIAEAHIRALESLDTPGVRFYNVGSGEGFSIATMIREVERVTGHRVPTCAAPRRAGDPAVLVAGHGKLAAELGWKPRHSELGSILSSAWQWRRAHPGGYGPDEQVEACEPAALEVVFP